MGLLLRAQLYTARHKYFPACRRLLKPNWELSLLTPFRPARHFRVANVMMKHCLILKNSSENNCENFFSWHSVRTQRPNWTRWRERPRFDVGLRNLLLTDVERAIITPLSPPPTPSVDEHRRTRSVSFRSVTTFLFSRVCISISAWSAVRSSPLQDFYHNIRSCRAMSVFLSIRASTWLPVCCAVLANALYPVGKFYWQLCRFKHADANPALALIPAVIMGVITLLATWMCVPWKCFYFCLECGPLHRFLYSIYNADLLPRW